MRHAPKLRCLLLPARRTSKAQSDIFFPVAAAQFKINYCKVKAPWQLAGIPWSATAAQFQICDCVTCVFGTVHLGQHGRPWGFCHEKCETMHARYVLRQTVPLCMMHKHEQSHKASWFTHTIQQSVSRRSLTSHLASGCHTLSSPSTVFTTTTCAHPRQELGFICSCVCCVVTVCICCSPFSCLGSSCPLPADPKVNSWAVLLLYLHHEGDPRGS